MASHELDPTSPQIPLPISHQTRLLREPLSSSWLIYPHPSHPFRACLSPTGPLRLSPTTRPCDLALLRCLCPVAPVQASVHAWLFTCECKQTHKGSGSASLAAGAPGTLPDPLRKMHQRMMTPAVVYSQGERPKSPSPPRCSGLRALSRPHWPQTRKASGERGRRGRTADRRRSRLP